MTPPPAADQDSAAQQRLARVCRAAVIALAADGSAVTLYADAGPSIVHVTDGTAALIERAQQTCGEGPSQSAFSLQAPVIVDDLRGGEARLSWPALADAVDRINVGQFLALPVGVGAIRLGVLSVYHRRPGLLSHGQLSTALLAADTAALALLDAEGETPDTAPLSELGPVLDYRIHQATGMVMGQTGLGGHDALTLLRARSFSESIPLQRLATDVVDRRTRFHPEKP